MRFTCTMLHICLYVTDALPTQYVRIYVNGVFVEQLGISTWGEYSVKLPSLQESKLDIALEYENAISPAELEMGGD